MSTDARFPCEHGWYERHEWAGAFGDPENYGSCPGGSTVKGEKVWWCEIHRDTDYEAEQCAEFHPGHGCGWRLLIPID